VRVDDGTMMRWVAKTNAGTACLARAAIPTGTPRAAWCVRAGAGGVAGGSVVRLWVGCSPSIPGGVDDERDEARQGWAFPGRAPPPTGRAQAQAGV